MTSNMILMLLVMMVSPYCWYDADPHTLEKELDQQFFATTRTRRTTVDEQEQSEQTVLSTTTKAIITPHAGYRYCGSVAANAYNTISDNVNRVFILGPSHHQYLDNCALPHPSIHQYDTPFGPLKLDEDVLGELRGLSKSSNSGGEFGTTLTKEEDEDEHSIEMQLPLIYHQLKHRLGIQDLTIVPILVGVLSPNVERVVGRLLAKYFKDPGTLFVISSDFCHWGTRFRYTQLQKDKVKLAVKSIVFDPNTQPINAGIEAMDREGMELIVNQDSEGFKRYLQMTGNTICGRHPISVLLEILRNVKEEYTIKFVDYNQSTLLPSVPCRNDSCVAYAAGVVDKQ
ncbi:Protein C2orf4, putative [Perkinsus marinus ATCC 50983]|uniref:Protein C2orf4, putative n=1 Tax=Perkinsus marinus (strain ATCC 50983 / TXsc) TaxID=423536 RepID=C5L0Q2_PERM5|nr:Protein C2orf4, putative [Perkinsus marinus ATCC 50983]EER09704.1 Protein C2orf4, putative [Perkinsus marinus ATCC 50983]|eukprot:XP_002777909.1 Protein C2orf4, putative [Perkinsus marinus ATCC 50983]